MPDSPAATTRIGRGPRWTGVCAAVLLTAVLALPSAARSAELGRDRALATARAILAAPLGAAFEVDEDTLERFIADSGIALSLEERHTAFTHEVPEAVCRDLFMVYLAAGIRFGLEHPEQRGNPLAHGVAAFEAVLDRYAQWRARDASVRSMYLETAARKRAEQRLEGFVRSVRVQIADKRDASKLPALIPAEVAPPTPAWDSDVDFAALRQAYGARTDYRERCEDWELHARVEDAAGKPEHLAEAIAL